MALIKCKECGNEVSSTAQTCPKCGAKVKKKTGILTWIVGIVFAMVVIGMVSGNLEQSEQQEAKQQQAAETKSKQEAEKKRVEALTPEQKAEHEMKVAEERAAKEAQERREQGIAWNYRTDTDKMSAKETRYATLRSINTVNFDFPYQGDQRATLTLRAHPRFGKDAILSVEKGQYQCGYDSCSVKVRFGDGGARSFGANEPDDNSSEYLFIEDYATFLANVRKVEKIYIEASFYQEGNRVFEFDVRGLDWK